MTNVDGLKDLKNLQSLGLCGCEDLTNVDGLKDLRNLQALDIDNTNRLPTNAINELQKQLPQTMIIYRYMQHKRRAQETPCFWRGNEREAAIGPTTNEA